MAGRALDGDWISDGLLSPLRLLRRLFPAAGAGNLPPSERSCAMRHPFHVAASVAWLQLKNALLRRKRFPFVLMLEPLYTCNLACIGCTPERHTGKLSDRLS